KEHPQYTHETAANGDGKEDPYGGQAHRTAHYVGEDQVSFHLLKDQEHDHKDQSLHGRHHQNQEGSHSAADKSTDNGDQGRDRDQSAHQHSIGQLQYQHHHKEHSAQDHRRHALPGNKAGKYRITETACGNNPLRSFLGQQRKE